MSHVKGNDSFRRYFADIISKKHEIIREIPAACKPPKMRTVYKVPIPLGRTTIE